MQGYRVPHFELSVSYCNASTQLLRGLWRFACTRETHVSLDCTSFNSTATCCSAPEAIEDRY